MNWKRSSYCGESACIEAAVGGAGDWIRIGVRNSSNPDETPAVFTVEEWPFFLAGVKGDGPMWDWFRAQDEITYTNEEAEAFRAGVLAGEFDYERLPVISMD